MEFEPNSPLTATSLVASKLAYLLALLSIFTNLFVFWALTKTKNWFSASNVLFLNLFICDTLFCSWEVVLNSLHVFTGLKWLDFQTCQIGGFLTQTLVGTSFLTVLLQTLNPFNVIVLGWPSLSGKQMSLFLGGIWLFVGGLTANMPFIGGDTYVPQPSHIWCHLNYASGSIWTRVCIFLNITLIAASPFMMLGAYTLMWMKMRRKNSQSRSNKTQWHIVRNGSYFIITSIVFWVWPARVMIVQFWYQSFTSDIDDIWYMMLGNLPTLFNSLIFVAVNSQVRQTIFRIFDPDYVALSSENAKDTISTIDIASKPESILKVIAEFHQNRD